MQNFSTFQSQVRKVQDEQKAKLDYKNSSPDIIDVILSPEES